MTDQLTKLRARKAAEDYIEGDRLRKEASQLSDSSLAAKFEVSVQVIRKAINSLPSRLLTEDEAALVRECHREFRRLTLIAEALTLRKLARHYQVEPDDVLLQLDFMGHEITKPIGRPQRVSA